jgi:hypothetical protein
MHMLCGTSKKLECRYSDTIDSLAEAAVDWMEQQWPETTDTPFRVKLCYNGRHLSSGKCTLREAGVSDGAHIDIVQGLIPLVSTSDEEEDSSEEDEEDLELSLDRI